LSLEWQVLNFSHIEVLHLYQLFDALHAILKSNFGLLINVTKLSRKDGFILTKVNRILITEFKTLVKLDFKCDISGNSLDT